jgi:tetratricopeptide (TPR) repeat protein
VLERRKKISKKQIKEDKLVTSYYKAIEFYQKYQAKILIGVGAFALIVIAVVLFSNKRANDNQAASLLLAKIMPLYDAGSFKEAIEGVPSASTMGLKAIVDKYGSCEQGENAKIFLANAYSVTGNNDAAYKYYDDYSGSNPLLKATSLAGKAGCLESKKDYEKAGFLYRDAARISKSNPANSDYLLRAGINLIKAGKKDEAKNVFESIKNDYKNTTAAYELERYLVQIES